jgi:MSHA biogenesis protein MshM
MYRQHFGFSENAFSLTPDTQFYFNSPGHRDVLNTLLLALKHSEGFIKVVGEVGTGKTLLGRKLLTALSDRFITAYVPNPYLTPEELKWLLAEEIGIPYNNQMPSYQLLREITQKLIALAAEKRQVVLIIDEAQAMPRETIEALRLLTNLETEKSKLLQVVLMGQPELNQVLARTDLRQLNQRIVFSETIPTLNHQKVKHYVEHRLRSAGCQKNIFSSSALRLLTAASGGVPRLINILAHKALLAAYGKSSEKVARAHMVKAVLDTPEAKSWGRFLAKRDYWFWPLMAATDAVVLGLSPAMGVSL